MITISGGYQMIVSSEIVPCSACGKKVPMDCMALNIAPGTRMAESSGRYADGVYHVCCECLLDKLGVYVVKKVQS